MQKIWQKSIDKCVYQLIAKYVGEYNYIDLVLMSSDGLREIEEQTLELCLLSVHANGMTLKYTIDQTPEICLEVVTENCKALKYVRKQTP